MATQPKGPPGSDFEVPDLDVEGSLRPAPMRRPSGTRAATPAQPDPFADGLELGSSALASLELATDQESSGATPSAHTMGQYLGGAFEAGPGDGLDLHTDDMLPLEPAASVDDVHWSSGLTPARESLAIDPSPAINLPKIRT